MLSCGRKISKLLRIEGFGQAFAGGVGLFSDGYLNGVSGLLTTMIGNLYPVEYTLQKKSLLNSVIFIGNVIGMLSFGFLCDKVGRKYPLIIASLMLVIFAVLSSAAYYRGTNIGVINTLIIYRFFLGIGIGGEYPAGSTTISEGAQSLPGRHKHSLFIFLTNTMICTGFVVAAFVSHILALIFGEQRQNVIWRLLLALGSICPFILLIFRLRMGEPDSYKTYAMKNVSIPYKFIFKKYGVRLFFISLVWFIYNFTAYSFGIYFAPILQSISEDMTLAQIFGWTTLLYLFYLPGSFCGAFATDYIEPKNVLAGAVFVQAIFGFSLAAFYTKLKSNVVLFILLYGLFMTFGEFGPGDNIGNISAKAPPTPVRGQFYSIAAASGKFGAFLGSYVFNYIIKKFGGPNSDNGNRGPFFIGSGFVVLSGVISLFFLPKLSQDCVRDEDQHFKEWLEQQGFDTSRLGLNKQPEPKDLNEQYESLEKRGDL